MAADDGLIRHVLRPAEWAEAQAAGAIRPPSLAVEGFVHCSTAAQLPGVIGRFYADIDADDLTIAAVDPAGLDVRWEAPAHPDGSPNTTADADARFPHVYEAIPLGAVVTVQRGSAKP